MPVWTIGYIVDGDDLKPAYIEVFANTAFEAYRNGWEMSTILESKKHERIVLILIKEGSIESNKQRHKIEEKFIKKVLK